MLKKNSGYATFTMWRVYVEDREDKNPCDVSI